MSPQPRILHPVPVTIEQVDVSDQATGGDTFHDDDFREPVQQVDHDPAFIVDGQPKWGSEDELGTTKGGVASGASGYVLFRFIDLENHPSGPKTLKQNDRFTKIGKIDTDVYIVSLRPVAHWNDIGGATLVKAFFADREPSRQG